MAGRGGSSTRRGLGTAPSSEERSVPLSWRVRQRRIGGVGVPPRRVCSRLTQYWQGAILCGRRKVPGTLRCSAKKKKKDKECASEGGVNSHLRLNNRGKEIGRQRKTWRAQKRKRFGKPGELGNGWMTWETGGTGRKKPERPDWVEHGGSDPAVFRTTYLTRQVGGTDPERQRRDWGRKRHAAEPGPRPRRHNSQEDSLQKKKQGALILSV